MARRAKKARKKTTRNHLGSQLTFGFKRRGGHRVGRPKKAGSGVSHLKREALAARFPVHVVMTLDKRLPSLRTKKPFKGLRGAFRAGCDRNGFRLNHFSVQGNHLHFIVEATNRTALSRGLQGLSVRIARALNKVWRRTGKVFADRYFDRILRTQKEVRNALQYVLKNTDHHKTHAKTQRPLEADPIDIFCSGMFFDGWREFRLEELGASEPPPLVPARTWLQRVGWRRHGLLSVYP
ncbi:MAG: hypothetical protein GY711_22315 [bacterium]|nr:hypothetical protein [bacterium]